MSSLNILENLNSEQKKAVKAINGPVLILAGAGSGKTRCLTHKIAFLIKKGVMSHNILGVTFTNKAAHEMKERVAKLLKNKHKIPLISTFHALCVRILRQEAAYLGLKPRFLIYDKDDQQKLIKQILKQLELDTAKFHPNLVIGSISRSKNQLITWKNFQNQAQDFFEEKISIIYEKYQDKLKQLNALDFDDLIMKAVELFQKNPKILEKYQNKFKYILVDEYQDTNHSQYVLINLLAKKYKNICVVGDDAQSIYAWRGANLDNILNFERDYPDAKVYYLKQNYRSTKKILKLANCIICQAKGLKPKNLWTNNKQGSKINILELDNEQEEADYIVDEINFLKEKNKLDFADFTVLYRTNTQSRAIEEALLSYNTPYKIIGGIKFYARAEIKDALAHLRLILNPVDELSIARIGKRASKTLLEKAENTNFSKKSLEKILNFAFSATGFLEKLRLSDKRKNENREENVKELFTVIGSRDTVLGLKSIELFLEQTSLFSDLDEAGRDNAVHLMTMHSAKGLEFPVVFISGFEEGIFPHYKSLDKPSQLQEELRLCYVGITRAQKYLYLTFTQSRNIWGQKQYNIPSRFLKNIPKELIEFNIV
ncbi:ATP-dependent DNA helicase PcrA [bacterium]|nr:ATP-dependent DNA helicase PcrA [bacterium]